MGVNLVVYTLLAYCFFEIETARILAIYPTPSISHQVVFRPLTKELIKRGHEVVVVTTDPAFPKGKAPANLTEIDVHDISYNNWNDIKNNGLDKDSILEQIKVFFERFASTLDLQLGTPEVQKILKNDKNYFDLLILEACNRPAMGITNLFDAPVIQFSSFGAVASQYELYGAPTHPILFPTPERQRLYNLSYLEKGVELLKKVMLGFLISTTEDFDYNIMRKHFGKDVPTFRQLRNKMKLLLVNEHPIWSDNRPVPPNIVYIGGIHQTPTKELPKDIKSFLDASKHGVIYFSFGTNVLPSALPREKIDIIMKVLSELPYDVLFKWDQNDFPGLSDNIRISKWFPQADLLKHPKVKLFITQGGLQSTDETIDAGVPVIGMPMLGDQWYNVEKYVHHKIGKQFNIYTLKEDEFKTAVETVIGDPSYKNNIIRLRTLMRQYPIEPLHLAVWWVEHIIKHGGDHIQPPTFHITWVEYYEVKLVSILLIILITVLTIIFVVTRAVFKYIYSKLSIISKLKLS